MSNQIVKQMAKDLKKASKKNDAPIWSKLAEMALKPSSVRRTVNINKINDLTKDNDVIVVPGKVLGTGVISHKITLSSFTISNSAATKILESGGKILNFENMIEQFPTGKGVIMLG
jgi:large subunit ribosomal protein L18e